MSQDRSEFPVLRRRLGTLDAVVIGLSAMIGAGVFTVFAPAAATAGRWLPAGLAVAALVAYCNATSSARLAARYPASGGTYVYGRERLGPFWGHLAGWSFVVGKSASCAAMALTVGTYLWPAQSHAVAVATVLVLTGMNYAGVERSAALGRLVVAAVLAVLVVLVMTGAAADPVATTGTSAPVGVLGVLQAGGLLFFAFAGYARIATLGEEVRDPARTIPRAIPIALGITVVVYLGVALTLLHVLGVRELAGSPDPLARAAAATGIPGLVPAVRVAAVLGAVGSLLALILGVSRTTLAMARGGDLPRWLTAVHPRFEVPHRAQLAVGLVVTSVAAVADLRSVIGFSSFGVLLYYAVANASAWTLTTAEGRPPRLIPVVGLTGCLVLAATLPPASAVTGAVVVAAGAVVYALRRYRIADRPSSG